MSGAYLFVVSMDVDPAYEDLFNEVYDDEHIPFLMEVPGVIATRRAKATAFRVAMAGEIHDRPAASPTYIAEYEIANPDVLTSPEWAAAVEKGRWPGDVRPHTSNRMQALYRLR